MRRVSLRFSDHGYGSMVMAWMSHPKIRTITRLRATHWIVNDNINLFFKYAQGYTTEENRSWYFTWPPFKWPSGRFYLCLRCQMDMVVLTREDIRSLETRNAGPSYLRWVRVVRDTNERWRIIGSNGNSMKINNRGGLGYYLMSTHKTAPPRLRAV